MPLANESAANEGRDGDEEAGIERVNVREGKDSPRTTAGSPEHQSLYWSTVADRASPMMLVTQYAFSRPVRLVTTVRRNRRTICSGCNEFIGGSVPAAGRLILSVASYLEITS